MYALMIGPNDFPNGDAGAVREYMFASIYQKLGHEVILIGECKKNKSGYYNGIRYYSVYDPSERRIEKVIKYITKNKSYINLINETIALKGLPDLIHIGSLPEFVIRYLLRLSKESNVTIIHDSTEWYSKCEFDHGMWDKAYILKNRLNKTVIRSPIKVMAISTYLESYFLGKGILATRIPVLFDVKNTAISGQKNDEKIQLIYAGSPAKKDYIREIITGINSLSEDEKGKLELHILGVNRKQLNEYYHISQLHECIRVYGRVSREYVDEMMQRMDFSVLLRPSDERYTKAGFPTKTVEAMAHGVAMICNITSDLDLYLQRGVNAILVENCSAEAFSMAVKHVLSLEKSEINEIKKNARLLAENNFDFRLWIEHISDFIKNENK